MRSTHSPHSRAAEGFGLVEVVVAMFLFMGVSLAILPVLVNGLKATLTNQNLTSAAQTVDAQLDLARSRAATCSSIASLAGSAASTTPGGVPVTTTTVVVGAWPAPAALCPVPTASYPTIVTVTTTVKRASTGANLASASTIVYVSAP